MTTPDQRKPRLLVRPRATHFCEPPKGDTLLAGAFWRCECGRWWRCVFSTWYGAVYLWRRRFPWESIPASFDESGADDGGSVR